MLRLFAALCIPAYVYFVVVQANDVDAWTWMVAYGLILLACWGVLAARFDAWWYRIVAVPYAIWGVATLMQTQGRWFDGEVEREAAGLGLCVVTLVVLSFARKRHTS